MLNGSTVNGLKITTSWPLYSTLFHPHRHIGVVLSPPLSTVLHTCVPLTVALALGGVAHDVTHEWLTLRISTAAKETPPHALTLL